MSSALDVILICRLVLMKSGCDLRHVRQTTTHGTRDFVASLIGYHDLAMCKPEGFLECSVVTVEVGIE
jgi:hypothetical protein